MIDAATIEKEALLLPENDRALLADRLLESLSPTDPSLRKAWVEELDSRMEAFHRGEIEALDGPQTMANLLNRFK